MKKDERNTTKVDKIEITGEMEEIGFDEKRAEKATKTVKKESTPQEKTTKTKTASKVSTPTAEKKTSKTVKAQEIQAEPTKKEQRKAKKDAKKTQKAERKAVKSKIRQQKKENKNSPQHAQEKAEKKAEKQRIKAEKKNYRNQRSQERKDRMKTAVSERKEELARRKEVRKELRDKRKSMTKEEVASHKEAEKIQRKAEKLRRRAEKSRRKAEKDHAIAELKARGIKVGRSKGMLAAVITLSIVGGIAVLTSAGLATANAMYMREMDAVYMHAYYDVLSSANSLSTSLAKGSVSKGSTGLVATFTKASSDAYSAEEALESIPCEGVEKQQLIKFFNEAGAFAKGIAQKSVSGEELSAEEKALLEEVSKTAVYIKEELNKAFSQSMNGERKMHMIRSMVKGDIAPDVTSAIKNISELSISNSGMAKEKAVANVEKSQENITSNWGITKEEARNIVSEKLQAENVQYITETISKDITTYDFKFKKYGVEVYCQVDKACGKIVMTDAYKPVEVAKINSDTALAKAKEYLKIAGFEDMTKVWESASGNTITYSFAKMQNGAVIYPQLVKVKVALSDGAILGSEGYSYVKNSKERNEKAKISLSEARGHVSSELTVQTEKLVVIPLASGEKLCYEFMGQKDGQTYFVYIDANTGAQQEIYMVVEEGVLGNQVI